MFALPNPTNVILRHVNIRGEKNGKKTVRAIDLKFELKTGNDILDLFHPKLKSSLYYRAKKTDDQTELEGVEQIEPNRLFPNMAPTKWDLQLADMDLQLIYGLGTGGSNVDLEACKVDGFVITPEEGGTVMITFNVKKGGFQDGILDRITNLLDCTTEITLIHVAKLIQQAVIDGTVGHPGARGDDGDDGEGDPDEHQDEGDADAEAAAAEAVGVHVSDRGAWPFPKKEGAEPEPLPTATKRPARTKRGKDATAAFIAEHSSAEGSTS